MSKFKVGDKVVKANGEKWLSGAEYKLITEINFWHEEYRLSGIGWWDEKKLKLYEEIKEMKELTFKEVIANIKEGEVWESVQSCFQLIEISCLEGRIKFKLEGVFVDKTDYAVNAVDTGIGNGQTFKLKRKEYTFEEAFKAYEQGKEIESIYSKYKFKKENEVDLYTREGKEWYQEGNFEIDEIRGKWYIND